MKVIVLKGILLWLTILSITFFIIGGFESLVEANKGFPAFSWLVINIILGYTCYSTLSYRELYKLSGYRWFEKLI